MKRYDAIVIGGGLVGSAIAYRARPRAGWIPRSSTKAMSRSAPRAAISGWSGYRARATARRITSAGRGSRPRNGRRSPPSCRRAPGSRSAHERPGGVHLCLGEAEFEERRARMEQMRVEAGNFGFEYRMLDRAELADMLPGLGPSVTGASWTPYDGHANSLYLLHALHKGFVERGGRYIPNRTVDYAGRHRAISASAAAPTRSPRRRSCSPPGSAMRRWRRCSGSARRCGRSAARSSSPSGRSRVCRCRRRPSARRSKAAS